MCVDELTVIVDHHRNVSDTGVHTFGVTAPEVARWPSAGAEHGRPLGDERADGFGVFG